MSIHAINHDGMTAQAQYAEWLRRLQEETRAKIALRAEEAEAAERETPSEESEQDAEDTEGQPEAEQNAEPTEGQSPAEPEPLDDGHLRSFA